MSCVQRREEGVRRAARPFAVSHQSTTTMDPIGLALSFGVLEQAFGMLYPPMASLIMRVILLDSLMLKNVSAISLANLFVVKRFTQQNMFLQAVDCNVSCLDRNTRFRSRGCACSMDGSCSLKKVVSKR